MKALSIASEEAKGQGDCLTVAAEHGTAYRDGSAAVLIDDVVGGVGRGDRVHLLAEVQRDRGVAAPQAAQNQRRPKVFRTHLNEQLGLGEEVRVDGDVHDFDLIDGCAGRLGRAGLPEPILKVGRIPNLVGQFGDRLGAPGVTEGSRRAD